MLRNYTLLLIAILLLVVAYGYDKINNISLDHYTKKIESRVHKYEKEIINIFEDEAFIQKAINYDFEEGEMQLLENLSSKKYSIFIYQKPDSLIFWTSNKILPFDAEVEFSDKPISRFSTIKNGGYSVLNYPYIKNGEQYALVGMIPISHEYSIQNEFLVNGISIIDNIPDEVNMKFEPNEYEVKNLAGESLFFLEATGRFVDLGQQYLILILYLLGLITLFWFLNDVANQIARKIRPLFGVLFIISTVVFIRFITTWLGFGDKFEDIYIFSTKYFSDNSIISLGNLLINAFIGLWLMIFVYREFQLPQILLKDTKNHLYYSIVASVLIMAGLISTTETFRQLVLYSVDNFGIDQLYSLNTFPVFGTITLSLILFTLFLYIVKVKLITRLFKVSLTKRIIINAIILGVFTILYFIQKIDFALLITGVFGVVITSIAYVFVRQKSVGFLWLVGWICIFGAFSSTLFYEFNNLKEVKDRIFYAENLALERDIYTEEIFDNLAATITQDHFIKKISNLFFPRNRIVEQINEAYLKKNFSNKYDYSVHLYTGDSIGTKGEMVKYSYFGNLIDESQETNNPHLYYWNNREGEQLYIVDLPILADNRKYYKIVITLEPKTIEKLKDYPELLLDKSFDLQKKFKEYDFAIYSNGKKIKDKKDNYPEKIFFDIPTENNTIIEQDGKSFLIHITSDDRIVVIGKEVSDIGSAFSLFSYMFCLFLALFSILLTINRVAEKLPSGSFLDIRLPPSLRNKIQNNVVAIVVLAFIGIGVTTVFYFRSEADDYHKGRLKRKARAVNENVIYEMDNSDPDSFYLPDIQALSQIHSLDVSLYDFDGEIINSSQQEIIGRNLLSRRMDPVAFYGITKLNKELMYRGEEIGLLGYSTAYMRVRREGEIVAFISLPYYSEKENSRKDIGAFMGRLLNVYVLIFIFAGVVTFYLTGQITNPLDKLSRQMRNVKLGQRNEPLSWYTEDEIGILIEQYNKMLEELERSANLLAKSEREGAWREMAKQVAHEIKNPLTPMKLQIQFLQRAYKSRPEDIGPLLKRTAYTMIEQIDGLTRIASDFSNFAKMPMANNEYLELNSIVQSVFELFSKEEEVKLSVTITKVDCPIYADKDQVVRVLNNIIKNAIQAITFAIDYDREGTVDIYLERKGNVALVTIADNGTGIPKDKVEKVFVPNFTTKNSGTGLGLAMSKNIVEAAGGKIYFETEENVGTSFFVEIPIKEQEQL